MQKWSRLRHWTVRDVTSQRSEAGVIIAGVQAICTRTTDFDTSAAHMTSRLAVMQRRSVMQNRSLASRVPTTLLHYSGLKTFRCSDATARAVGHTRCQVATGGGGRLQRNAVGCCLPLYFSIEFGGARWAAASSWFISATTRRVSAVRLRSAAKQRPTPQKPPLLLLPRRICDNRWRRQGGERRVIGGSFPYGWTSKNYVICVCFHCHGTSWYHTTNALQGRRAKSHVDTQTIQPGLRDFVL